ncbi:MAG: uncharacterized protein JWP46_2524 [Modestobacter sp.]|nr:uncharacterized protein [Modestobacter sp.]
MFGFLAAAVAKFMSIGAVAQAAAGVGIVAASVTGAAAAGVLPGPVQDSVSSVVSAVSPFELPVSGDEPAATDEGATQTGEVPAATAEPTAEPTTEPTDPTGEPTTDPAAPTGEPTADPTTDPTTPTGAPTGAPTGRPTEHTAEWTRPTGMPTTRPDRVPFGRSVSEDARDGGVDGQETSDEARTKNHPRETGPGTQAPQRPTAAPSDPHQPDTEETWSVPEGADSTGRGQGGHGDAGGHGYGSGSGHR